MPKIIRVMLILSVIGGISSIVGILLAMCDCRIGESMITGGFGLEAIIGVTLIAVLVLQIPRQTKQIFL